jgi:hypothetical protein
MARSEMIRKPRTWPVFRVEQTSSVDQQKTGYEPQATFDTDAKVRKADVAEILRSRRLRELMIEWTKYH